MAADPWLHVRADDTIPVILVDAGPRGGLRCIGRGRDLDHGIVIPRLAPAGTPLPRLDPAGGLGCSLTWWQWAGTCTDGIYRFVRKRTP